MDSMIAVSLGVSVGVPQGTARWVGSRVHPSMTSIGHTSFGNVAGLAQGIGRSSAGTAWHAFDAIVLGPPVTADSRHAGDPVHVPADADGDALGAGARAIRDGVDHLLLLRQISKVTKSLSR